MIRFVLKTILAVAVLVVTMVAASCSTSRDLDPTGQGPTTTERVLGELDDRGGLLGGSQASRELRALFDTMLESNDACAILTQQNIEDVALDPSAFSSAEARAVLANGLIDVYDHLIDITDGSIDGALGEQRSTFVAVLDTVDRYALSPNSDKGNAEIQRLVETPEFLAAQRDVGIWIGANCG